jgi:hypothetical protein
MDIRTPYVDAQALAARIPNARLVEVPNTGHSVLGSEEGRCARDSVIAFFTAATVPACQPAPNLYRPTPRPPTRLSGIRGIGGNGPVGRTLGVAYATVKDARDQIIGEELEVGRAPNALGGLRGGTITRTGGAFRLNAYQYVPGVAVSGTIQLDGAARVSVSGGGAHTASLRITSSGRISGVVGGRSVSLAAPRR